MEECYQNTTCNSINICETLCRLDPKKIIVIELVTFDPFIILDERT